MLKSIVERAQVHYALENKADFGDVDILAVVKPGFIDGLHTWIDATFNPRAILRNSNVWSFNVEDLQIDLITTSISDFEPYFHFLCWGDMSMCLGRVSRLYDLKFGIDGLSLPVRDPDTNHVVAEISVSKEPRAIYSFLGYDYERWLRGFASMQEVIAFIFSSPRIHSGFMTANSERTKARRREAKDRKQWIEIMAWYSANQSQFPHVSQLLDPVPLGIEAKVAFVDRHFPSSQLLVKYNAVRVEIELRAFARAKFSGAQIRIMFPSLSKRDFGCFMDAWTAQWKSKDEQIQYILDHDVRHLTDLALQLKAE